MSFPLPTDIMASCDGFFYCMAKWAYTASEGTFFVFMLIGFMVVLFMASQRYGTTRAFGFAAVSGLLASIFLSTMQLMTWWISSIFILVGVVGFVALIMNEK